MKNLWKNLRTLLTILFNFAIVLVFLLALIL